MRLLGEAGSHNYINCKLLLKMGFSTVSRPWLERRRRGKERVIVVRVGIVESLLPHQHCPPSVLCVAVSPRAIDRSRTTFWAELVFA